MSRAVVFIPFTDKQRVEVDVVNVNLAVDDRDVLAVRMLPQMNVCRPARIAGDNYRSKSIIIEKRSDSIVIDQSEQAVTSCLTPNIFQNTLNLLTHINGVKEERCGISTKLKRQILRFLLY